MIRIEPRPGVREAEVTFIVSPKGLDGPMAVAGDFNEWDTGTIPMTARGGSYRATVMIGTGRRYSFKDFAGDRHWFNDEAADDYVSNELGGVDSVLDLRYLRWARPRAFAEPRADGCVPQ